MKWNEMKWNEMKWNEMKWNEMKWNEWTTKHIPPTMVEGRCSVLVLYPLIHYHYLTHNPPPLMHLCTSCEAPL